MIVGDIDHVRKRMAVRRPPGVTMMVVTAGSANRSATLPPWSDRSLCQRARTRVLDY